MQSLPTMPLRPDATILDDLRGLHWYEKIQKKAYTPPSTTDYKHFLASVARDLLERVAPANQERLLQLPIVAESGRLMLPWIDGPNYPFAFRCNTGSMKKAMLVKLLIYLLEHGPEHATWVQPGSLITKEPCASFYGLLEVRIPKDKVEAFSGLCGKLPLRRCWTVDRPGLKRKTVDHAWHTGGFEEEDWGDCGARLVFRPARLRQMLERNFRCRQNRVKRLRAAQEIDGDTSVALPTSVTAFRGISALILEEYNRARPAPDNDVGEEIEVLMTSADVEPEEGDVVVVRAD
jgi:hypothetical protein